MQSTSRTRALGAAFAAGLTVAGGSASAYTVRSPDLRSYLGQPLNALIRIDLDAGEAPPDEIRFATAEDLQRYGLDPIALQTANLVLRREDGADGVNVFVESRGGVLDPMFTLLLSVRRGSLRSLHEFTVMLDPLPANLASAPIVSSASKAAASAAPAAPAPAPSVAAVRAPAAASQPPRRQHHRAHHVAPSSWVPGGSYGPVVRNETLSEIAVRIRAGSGMRLHEIVRALVELNPEATKGREDFVAEGAMLRVPQQVAGAASRTTVTAAPPAPPMPAPLPAPQPAATATVPETPATPSAQPLARLRMETSLGSLSQHPELNAPTVTATPGSPTAATPATPATAAAPTQQTVVESTTLSAPVASTPSASAVGEQQPATPAETAPGTDAAAASGSAQPAVSAAPAAEPTHSTTAANEEQTQPGYVPTLKSLHPAAQAESPARGFNGWFAALLGVITLGLLGWARREEAFNRAAQEARVIAAKEQAAEAAAQSPGTPSVPAERRTADKVAPQDRAALLKQAYTARGKRFSDVRKS